MVGCVCAFVNIVSDQDRDENSSSNSRIGQAVRAPVTRRHIFSSLARRLSELVWSELINVNFDFGISGETRLKASKNNNTRLFFKEGQQK